jgi:hypothetical protein
MWAQVKAGNVRTVKLGARTLITDAELSRFLATLGATLDHLDSAA